MERAAAMSAWFCRGLDIKAAQNVATAQQHAKPPSDGGPSSGSMVQAGGPGGVGGPSGGATGQKVEDDMSEEDVSASEAENEARAMNGEHPKIKIRMKKGEARKVRERRLKKAA